MGRIVESEISEPQQVKHDVYEKEVDGTSTDKYFITSAKKKLSVSSIKPEFVSEKDLDV